MVITVESLQVEGRTEVEKQSLKETDKFHVLYATMKEYSDDGKRTGKAENETWKTLSQKEGLKIAMKQEPLLRTAFSYKTTNNVSKTFRILLILDLE